MTAREQQKHLFTGRWRNVRMPVPKEHQLQIDFVALMKWALRPDVMMFHVPNGELRDKVAAAKLKAMGVLPGVSDLVFMWEQPRIGCPDTRHFRALFLELKRSGGKLTAEQAAFGLAMRSMGADFAFVSSIDEAVEAVKLRGLLRDDRQISRSA
jgi:hypothetical protein